jgi:hypothetical protein
MTPSQGLQALDTMLDMLDRLLPGFHTTTDRADLTEARAALEDVHARLERQIAEDACDSAP